jgi:hypothetical protein
MWFISHPRGHCAPISPSLAIIPLLTMPKSVEAVEVEHPFQRFRQILRLSTFLDTISKGSNEAFSTT